MPTPDHADEARIAVAAARPPAEDDLALAIDLTRAPHGVVLVHGPGAEHIAAGPAPAPGWRYAVAREAPIGSDASDADDQPER